MPVDAVTSRFCLGPMSPRRVRLDRSVHSSLGGIADRKWNQTDAGEEWVSL